MRSPYFLSHSRRIYNRFKIESSAIVTVDKEEKPVILRDISSSGCCVVCASFFSPNTLISIVFDLPILKVPIVRKGKIVWCTRISDSLFRLGIDFSADRKIEFA